jgi:hypothetical protein
MGDDPFTVRVPTRDVVPLRRVLVGTFLNDLDEERP